MQGSVNMLESYWRDHHQRPSLGASQPQAPSHPTPLLFPRDWSWWLAFKLHASSHGHWMFRSRLFSPLKLWSAFPFTEVKYIFIFYFMCIVFSTLGGKRGGNNSGWCPRTVTNSQYSQLFVLSVSLSKKTAKKRALVLGQMESFNRKPGNWGGEERKGEERRGEEWASWGRFISVGLHRLGGRGNIARVASEAP